MPPDAQIPDFDPDQPLTESQLDEMDLMTKLFTPEMYDKLESELRIYAACRNWTGDPLSQPPQIVYNIARRIYREAHR